MIVVAGSTTSIIALDAVYVPILPYPSIMWSVVDSVVTSSPRSLLRAQACLTSILVATGRLRKRVPGVVLELVAYMQVSSNSQIFASSQMVRTLHGGVLCRVDAVCNDETWLRSVSPYPSQVPGTPTAVVWIAPFSELVVGDSNSFTYQQRRRGPSA